MTGIFSRSVTFFGKITPALLLLASAGFSKAQTPAQLSFANLVQPYDGFAKIPTVFTNPGGLSVQLQMNSRNSETVYTNIPAMTDLSYMGTSLGSYSSFGDVIRLGGTNRMLESVDFTLVNWSPASAWPALASANNKGYELPISVLVYSYNNGQMTILAQRNQTYLIPWRPETLDDGSSYPWNGITFKGRMNFPFGTTLTNDIAVLVTYNTQNGGLTPTGQPTPANSLNVALKTGAPTTGVNPSLNQLIFSNGNPPAFTLSSSFASYSPMLEVRTLPSNPPNITPIEPGHYRILATIVSPGYSGQGTIDFTVTKNPATISLGNLTQAADGSPKSVTVTTNPASLPFSILYNGQSTPPTARGRYPIIAAINSQHHEGTVTGTLVLGKSLATYMKPWIDAGLPQSGPLQDPDKDGIVNLLEYAFGTDPTNPGNFPEALLTIQGQSDHSLLHFRKQKEAIDLNYRIETTTDPTFPDSWTPLDLPVTVLSTDSDQVESVRMKVTRTSGEPKRFFRLKVSQTNP